MAGSKVNSNRPPTVGKIEPVAASQLDKINAILAANPTLASALKLKWTDYIPSEPTPKQRAFLLLPQLEALFGGAAGGGKSEALLMAALQYVDIPGYAALMLRRTLTDLKLPGSLLSRAHEWLGGRSDCKFSASEHAYYFPTVDPNGRPAEPARVVFGYLGVEGAAHRYRSAEFQSVFFDELTTFNEDDYTYLLSRLRKRVCPLHKIVADKSSPDYGHPNYVAGCRWCDMYKSIPIRMRAATNPGGVGHIWVKERFNLQPVDDSESPLGVRYVGRHPNRPFIPSFLTDNPYIDQHSYGRGLDQMDAVTREQLKHGDWGASADARFKPHWFRRYSTRGTNYFLGPSATGPYHPFHSLRIFLTLDPAASSREGPGDTDNWRKPNQSYTALGAYALTTDYHLLVLEMFRKRIELPDLLPVVRDFFIRYRPTHIVCEAVGLGKGAYQLLTKNGYPAKPVFPHADKLVRATDAITRAEQGRIWFPEYPGPSWLAELESELFSWHAHPHQPDDQVDSLAYAALDISWEAAAANFSNPDSTHSAPLSDAPSYFYPADRIAREELSPSSLSKFPGLSPFGVF